MRKITLRKIIYRYAGPIFFFWSFLGLNFHSTFLLAQDSSCKQMLVPLASHSQDLQMALKKSIVSKAIPQGADELEQQFLEYYAQKIQKNDFMTHYDVIILGGGVYGHQVALSLSLEAEKKKKVMKILVIDRGPTTPSPYAEYAEYFLNSPFEGFPESPLALDEIQGETFTTDPVGPKNEVSVFHEARTVARNLAINLFFANADVLLGDEFTGIQASDNDQYPLQVLTRGQRQFLTKRIVVSPGLGTPKDKVESEKTKMDMSQEKVVEKVTDGESIYDYGSFLKLIRKDPSHFKDKNLTIVGSSLSARSVLAALFGYGPSMMRKSLAEKKNNYPAKVTLVVKSPVEQKELLAAVKSKTVLRPEDHVLTDEALMRERVQVINGQVHQVVRSESGGIHTEYTIGKKYNPAKPLVQLTSDQVVLTTGFQAPPAVAPSDFLKGPLSKNIYLAPNYSVLFLLTNDGVKTAGKIFKDMGVLLEDQREWEENRIREKIQYLESHP